mmetsp:Transcript_8201/g.17918  ORF Transcript_8201/g.17918 Transcript_8201/m.17918 type:complete len:290 (+) Transcript_8201:53-922(+)
MVEGVLYEPDYEADSWQFTDDSESSAEDTDEPPPKRHCQAPPPAPVPATFCGLLEASGALTALPGAALLHFLQHLRPKDLCRLACTCASLQRCLVADAVDREVWGRILECIVPAASFGRRQWEGTRRRSLVQKIWCFNLSGSWTVEGRNLGGSSYQYTLSLQQARVVDTAYHPVGLPVKEMTGFETNSSEGRMAFKIEATLDGISLLMHQRCWDDRHPTVAWVNICHAEVTGDEMSGTWVQQNEGQKLVEGPSGRGRFHAVRQAVAVPDLDPPMERLVVGEEFERTELV